MVQYRACGARLHPCAVVRVASVTQVRRWLVIPAMSVTAAFMLPFANVSAAPDTTTTTTTPVASTTTTSTTTTSTTTTTTLPSAVTTVPDGCALPPVAQAVFVGRLTSKDEVSAVFEVQQVRAGTLGTDQPGASVSVRYGGDVKFLSTGTAYLVGVAPDPATLALSSTVRDAAELFGGAEVAGSNVKCPRFEAAARTLNVDGTSVDTGVFVGLFSQPWRLLLAFVLPGAFVLVALFGLVWLRRGTRR